MPNSEFSVWGIHGGATGDAENLFLKQKCIALGWPKMGNLSLIANDRDFYKQKLIQSYPEDKPGAVPVNAGQLYRFVHEIQIGDLAIYPSKLTREVHIGKIKGEYIYKPDRNAAYPNQREVEWLKTVPRTNFSQGALYEIGSAMSFFLIKNYAEEFISIIEGGQINVPVSADESVDNVAEQITETTQDFILKRLAQDMKGHPLSHFVAHILKAMGYRTRVAPEGPDGGIDIIAHKDELGFEPPLIKVQVKSSPGSVGEPIVSALYGNLAASEFGLFVTLGTFTSHAITFSRSKANLRLIDGDELVKLILEHYDQFDSGYKGFLPLKRVYVPDWERGEE